MCVGYKFYAGIGGEEYVFSRNEKEVTSMISANPFGRLFAVTSFVLTVAVAQDNSARPQVQQQHGGMGGMMQMMQQCRQHCQETQQSAGRLSKVIAEAKQSNDPARMRAALEQVEKHQSKMTEHMSMCMRSMGNMEKMHGNMGRMHEGMKQESGGKKTDPKK